MRPYSPLAAANYIIKGLAPEAGVEHMKLQKLVYNAYGWWIAFHENDSLINERPQVWKFGPVFNSLYHILKPFGRTPIKTIQSKSPFDEAPYIDGKDDDARNLLAWVWNRYGHLSSLALSDMTHKPGTPWQRVASERNFSVPFGLEIPDDYIREEFRRVYAKEFGGAEQDGKRAAQG